MTVLHATDLTVEFGPTTALRNLTLGVEPGELVAVVGRSGSGKSTLLHCLAGVLRPHSGAVEFRGQRVSAWSDSRRSAWRLRNVGLVFQFGELVPELTLAENVRLPLLLTGVSARDARRRAGAVIDRLGLAEVAERRPGQTSGGQMQRAAIARALVHEPAVVLADEPTGALDAAHGQLVLEAMLSLARDRGSAVVLVTHEARLSSYCDREVTLLDGTVAEPVLR